LFAHGDRASGHWSPMSSPPPDLSGVGL
jgi:hypothetical protein